MTTYKTEGNYGYLIGITLVATIGGLLFGYDTAVISGAEKSIQEYLIHGLGLSTFVHGATISSALIGCIIGAVLSGTLARKFGRKKVLLFAAFLFFISALGSGFPEFLFFKRGEPTMGLLIMFNVYRIIGGVGVGLASAVCPMYIGEIAPAHLRGRLVSLNQFAIIFGMLVVYMVNRGIANGQTIEWINEIGWRNMFLSEAIPAGLFGILLFFVPESPRYLALTNNDDKALTILAKINGLEKAKQVLAEIKGSIEQKYAHIFSYGKLVIVIGVLLSVFQQVVGINVALYYAPRIFETMGADKDASMMQTVVMGGVNVIFTILAILTVDKLGRKPLLMMGSVGMAIGMFALALFSYFEIISSATLVFIIVYTAAFMMSWGPICWVLISEIFPNNIRGKAVAIAVAAQWITNYIISSTGPSMLEYSSVMTYSFYGVMSVLSLLFVWKMVPETKNKTLEEIEKIWK